MKTCPICNGALDENGKCLGCGTVTQMKVGADGVTLDKMPEELIDALCKAGESYPVNHDELTEALKQNKTIREKMLIDGCKYCLNACDRIVLCNKNGTPTKRFSIVCTYCSDKKSRKGK